MKKGKILFLAALTSMGLLTGCGGKAKYTIGICQLATHPALDAATQGFMDAIKDKLGSQVKFDLQIASGDSGVCSTIVNSFVAKNVDLMMANATPALQASANATTTIPVLGTSITEYGVALGIKDFKGVTGINVSGTSDLAPLEEQATMLTEVFPTANRIGLLYCSAEANSLYQVQVVEEALQAKGKTTKRIPFSESNDISPVLRGSLNDIDALYIPTDNTCADNATTIDAICAEKKLPVFAGEENLCAKCGAITLSISYYNIGLKTGKMALEILENNADVSKMAIAYDENPVKKYNETICARLGITPPAEYEKI